MNTIDYSIPFSMTEEDLDNLMATAFEGGIGYWARLISNKGPRWEWTIIDAESDQQQKYKLSLDVILRGFSVAAQKYPRHFANWATDNYDAETADVIVQCAIFGEIVYG